MSDAASKFGGWNICLKQSLLGPKRCQLTRNLKVKAVGPTRTNLRSHFRPNRHPITKYPIIAHYRPCVIFT